jgi:hypothetical protein
LAWIGDVAADLIRLKIDNLIRLSYRQSVTIFLPHVIESLDKVRLVQKCLWVFVVYDIARALVVAKSEISWVAWCEVAWYIMPPSL